MGELPQLCLSFQRDNLKVMEGHCLAKTKIEKFCSQNLKDERDVQLSENVKEVMRTSADRETSVRLLFSSRSSVTTWMLVFQKRN